MTRAFEKLISELVKLPGIGPKTAQRLAFYLLKVPAEEVDALARALLEAKQKLRPCRDCFNLTEAERCAICTSAGRDRSLVCVVEEASDIEALEKGHDYHGLYHVLGGALSPMDGIGPDDLHIAELVLRLKAGGITEVIVATNPNTSGEATAAYLATLIKPLGVRVTRIARGLPMGSDLAWADEVTLARALEGRKEI